MEFNLEDLKIGKVLDNLYIGPGDQVYNLLAHYPAEERPVAILNVADDYSEKPHPRYVLYVHAGLNDGPPDWSAPWGEHNQVKAYTNAILSLCWLLDYYTVFVHCHGGVSRSPFIAAWALGMKGIPLGEYKGASPDLFNRAYMILKQKYPRANVHPKHFSQLEIIASALNSIQ